MPGEAVDVDFGDIFERVMDILNLKVSPEPDNSRLDFNAYLPTAYENQFYVAEFCRQQQEIETLREALKVTSKERQEEQRIAQEMLERARKKVNEAENLVQIERGKVRNLTITVSQQENIICWYKEAIRNSKLQLNQETVKFANLKEKSKIALETVYAQEAKLLEAKEKIRTQETDLKEEMGKRKRFESTILQLNLPDMEQKIAILETKTGEKQKEIEHLERRLDKQTRELNMLQVNGRRIRERLLKFRQEISAFIPELNKKINKNEREYGLAFLHMDFDNVLTHVANQLKCWEENATKMKDEFEVKRKALLDLYKLISDSQEPSVASNSVKIRSPTCSSEFAQSALFTYLPNCRQGWKRNIARRQDNTRKLNWNQQPYYIPRFDDSPFRAETGA